VKETEEKEGVLTVPNLTVKTAPWRLRVFVGSLSVAPLCTSRLSCKPLPSIFNAHVSTQCKDFVFLSFCYISDLHCEPLTPKTKGKGYSYMGGTVMIRS
jgi:hypothetical protein